jgi:hypothetical protein
MSSHEPTPDRSVDDLVRSFLRRRAEETDPREVLRGVRRRMDAPPGGGGRPSPRWVLLLVAAAALLVAFLGGQDLGPGGARAGELVREARQTHALPLDRCYLVQIEPEPGTLLARLPILAQARETRLWTRGDRFWIESTNPVRKWAWGRDEQGSVWLALGHKQGVRFEANEVPAGLAVACDVLGLKVETLLGELSARFDLRRDDGVSDSTYRIRATPKAGARPVALRGAELEIAADSHVLRRLVLQRTRWGRPTATVTFTLLEEGTQQQSRYQLDGHLDPGAPVFSFANKPGQRRLLMNGVFGPDADDEAERQ